MYCDELGFILRLQGYFNQYKLFNLHCKEEKSYDDLK